ncbi:MAG TPA: hypothetical protein VF275_02760 [Gammaproteobacteria bacterium]
MNALFTIDTSSRYAVFEIVRAIFAERAAVRRRKPVQFVVRARFVGAATRLIAADSREMYLSENRGWQPLENATRFEAREDAEAAAYNVRKVIRNTGNRTVSVSVMACQG